TSPLCGQSFIVTRRSPANQMGSGRIIQLLTGESFSRKEKPMRSFVAPSLLFCASLVSAFAQAPIGVRILFGVTDQQSTKWDGSLTARNADVRSIEPWRFEPEDSISGTDWKISTHPVRLF